MAGRRDTARPRPGYAPHHGAAEHWCTRDTTADQIVNLKRHGARYLEN